MIICHYCEEEFNELGTEKFVKEENIGNLYYYRCLVVCPFCKGEHEVKLCSEKSLNLLANKAMENGFKFPDIYPYEILSVVKAP